MTRYIPKSRTAHVITIIFLVIAAYSVTLQNRFNIDDPAILLNDPAVHGLSLKNLKAIFTTVHNSVEYLPVRDLTYAMDYELWGLNPLGYHLSNILYYLLTCLLLYFFFARLLGRWHEEPGQLTFVATAIFVLHPSHVESVAGIAQRKDLISGLFFFLSLWSFLLYKDTSRKWAYILSLIAFCLSMLSKATSIVLPVIILLIHLMYQGKDINTHNKKMHGVIMFFIIAAGLFSLNIVIAKQAGLIQLQEFSLIERISTAFRAVFYYLKILIVPYPLNVWHEFRVSKSLFEISALLSMSGIFFMLYVLYRLRKTDKTLLFSSAFFLICLMPVTGLLPASTIVAERYLFLPSAGFSLSAAWLFLRGMRKKMTAMPVLVLFLCIVISFAVISFQRGQEWKNTETLLRADLAKNPDSLHMNKMLGRYYFINGKYEEAFRLFQKAKEIQRADIDYEFFLSYYMFLKGRYTDALSMLDSINTVNYDVVDIHYLYGIIYKASGEYEKARQRFIRAMQSEKIIGFFFKNNARTELMSLPQSDR